MWLRSFILLYILVWFAPLAHAGDVMTWEDCVKTAAKKNPDIRSASETLSSSEYKATAAWSAFLPTVSATMNINSGNSSTLSATSSTPTGGSTSSSSDTFYSASISATQNVFSGFHDKATIDQTVANRDVSRSSLENTKVKVSYSLKTAFASLMYSQEYSDLADKIIKRRDENAQIVELRFESGMENKGSVLLSKAFLGQAKYDKNIALHAIKVSQEQLASVLGEDNSDKIKISGKIPLKEPDKAPDYIGVALQNPLYRQSVAKEKASKAGVTIARSQFSPNVNLFATASRQGSKWFPSGDRHSFGLNVSLPLFNGGNHYFTLKSSESDLSASRFNRESVEKQLLPQLKQAYEAYVDAFQKLQVDKDFLEAATVRADIARGKYNNGLLSFEDWDIIENDLITKQKTYIQSERDLNFASAAWDQAQGKGAIQ